MYHFQQNQYFCPRRVSKAVKSPQIMKMQKRKITGAERVVERITNQIRRKIDEGSETLEKNTMLRLEIDDTLRRNRYHEQPSRLYANELMKELTKSLIEVWPNPRDWAFQTIEERLKPLQEIAKILNSKGVEKHIHVRDNPCVMKESRMSLDKFKKLLREGLFAD